VTKDRTEVFQPLLEVGPATDGSGFHTTLQWDGAEGGIIVAEMNGQEVTTDVGQRRLLLDVDELIELACAGSLQVIRKDDELIAKLREYVNRG
jgi:hypothetical protein